MGETKKLALALLPEQSLYSLTCRTPPLGSLRSKDHGYHRNEKGQHGELIMNLPWKSEWPKIHYFLLGGGGGGGGP